MQPEGEHRLAARQRRGVAGLEHGPEPARHSSQIEPGRLDQTLHTLLECKRRAAHQPLVLGPRGRRSPRPRPRADGPSPLRARLPAARRGRLARAPRGPPAPARSRPAAASPRPHRPAAPRRRTASRPTSAIRARRSAAVAVGDDRRRGADADRIAPPGALAHPAQQHRDVGALAAAVDVQLVDDQEARARASSARPASAPPGGSACTRASRSW